MPNTYVDFMVSNLVESTFAKLEKTNISLSTAKWLPDKKRLRVNGDSEVKTSCLNNLSKFTERIKSRMSCTVPQIEVSYCS